MVEPENERLGALEKVLGYTFTDRTLLARALRHGSSDAARDAGSYQRLEFLGDAVLGHAVALMLYSEYPDADEGLLSRMRSHLVRSESLAGKAAWLGLDGWVQVGWSEEKSRGRVRSALLEDVFEAVIGAMAVDGGWENALAFVREAFEQDLQELDETTLVLTDAKSALNQAAQARGLPDPEYREVRSGGSDHKPIWTFAVHWKDDEVARGEGRSKRQAQQQAARRALARLGLLPAKTRRRRKG